MQIAKYRKIINEKRQERRTTKQQLETTTESLSAVSQKEVDVAEALSFVQQVAQTVQQQVHNQIANVVSHCLSAVFDEPYKFCILFERKRNRTEARLVFERNGIEVDPLTASGGGVVDVAAFALRLSCMMLHKPVLRKILIMDEPFKFVSENYQDRVRILLETLMGVQFIMVTHIPRLKCGSVIEIA